MTLDRLSRRLIRPNINLGDSPSVRLPFVTREDVIDVYARALSDIHFNRPPLVNLIARDSEVDDRSLSHSRPLRINRIPVPINIFARDE